MMVVLILQKKAMVLLFIEVFSYKGHKLVGQMNDFLTGESVRKNIGKLSGAAQSEKLGKRTPVEFFRQTKADL